ncbi:hypothetical protein GCM10020256_50100 [Streptomyces thermocoprophilus]
MRLEHGRDTASHGEPPGQSRLGAVRVHQVGPYLRDDPGQPPHLAEEGGARRTRRPPGPHVRAAPAQSVGERAVGAGHGDPRAGGQLGPYEVRHDTGDAAVHRLGDVQDPRRRVGWLVHCAVSSLTGGRSGRGGNWRERA